MRKKLGIVVNSLGGGGAERTAINLAAFMSRRGWDIVVVTLESKDADSYTLHVGARRYALAMGGESRGLMKIVQNVRRVRALRKILKVECPDVIVGLVANTAIFSILAGWGLCPVVAAERNNPQFKKARIAWGLLRKFVYRWADAVVAQTCEIASWLEAHTYAKNIVVIPNAITWPMGVYRPLVPPSEVVAPDQKVLLAAGRFHEQKGFDLLIQAFSRVSYKHPNWVLVILGDHTATSLFGALNEQISTLGLTGRVLMPGRVGNIPDWYARCDAFVLSSRYEGFPNVLLEAMASGCACVSFDCCSGPRDVISHGVDGLLVARGDTTALAEQLDRLMSDNALRRLLGTNAREVRRRFSEDVVLGKWIDLFEKLTNDAVQ